ncbi:unnamed protein product, partial [Staurois parvus]
ALTEQEQKLVEQKSHSGHTWIKICMVQGRTDNSWGPRAIGDHGTPVSCPNSKKPMKKVPGAYHGAPY